MAANFYGPQVGTVPLHIPTVGYIPPFVAEAVVEAAIARGDVCPITFTPFAECEVVKMTSCYHIFEGDVIDKIMKKDHWRQCPTCRKRVDLLLTVKRPVKLKD